MDDIRARQGQETIGASPEIHGVMGDPSMAPPADDPLGDEAAFPSTWQHLAAGDASRD